MTSMRTIAFRPFDAGLRAMLCVGPAILVLVALFTVDSPGGWIAIVVAGVVLVVVTFFSGVRIRADESAVSIALVPFWGKRMRWSDISSIDVDEVRPFEDFGGWGIKGSQKREGLLLSAGETRSVKLTLTDGRRYLVAVGDAADDAARDLRRLSPALRGEGTAPGRHATTALPRAGRRRASTGTASTRHDPDLRGGDLRQRVAGRSAAPAR